MAAAIESTEIEGNHGFDGPLETPSETSLRISPFDWLPATLAAFGTVVAIGGTQGGYFPTSWGPSSLCLLALVAFCLAFGATSDAGRLDAIFVLAPAVLIGWIA